MREVLEQSVSSTAAVVHSHQHTKCSQKNQEPGKMKKTVFSVLLFLALAGLTFYAVFHGNDMTAVAAAMGAMRPGYLMLAIACALLFVCGEGFMIWYLLHALNDKTRLRSCIRYSFIGFFYSGITPSATGGQPMQLYYMKKDGQKLSESTVVLMTVAVLYKLVLVLIGAGILLFYGKELNGYLGEYCYLYDLGLALNVILVVVLFFVMIRPVYFKKFLFWGERGLVRLHLLKLSEKRQKAVCDFVDSYQETVTFFQKNMGRILVVTLVTFLQRSSLFVLTWFIYRGFSLDTTGAGTVILLQAAVYVAVDMLPLPGAQGISELMYKHVFTGIFTGNFLTASICLTRGLNFYMLLIISAVVALTAWFMSRKPIRSC